MPRILVVDRTHPDHAAIAKAAELLREGALVAFPTETVYGLGAHALDVEAVRRIYEAKGRPSWNPLIVHVSDAGAARALAREWPAVADVLARAFWPGPLTLVVRKRAGVPDEITAGLDTVGLRVPSHPVALALLRAATVPVAAPSANRFTRISPTTAAHVARGLGDRVDLIVDGGPSDVGIESTVLDVSGEVPTILRPGHISLAQLAAVAGAVRVASDAEPDDLETARRSPGTMGRHYAPSAAVIVFGPADRARAAEAARLARAEGHRVGALLLSPLDAPIDDPVAMRDDPAAYAHQLYAALHDLDARGCDVILIERVSDDDAWAGVRDRIERAAR